MAPFRAPIQPLAGAWSGQLLVGCLIIAALYVGRDVLAPLALALLLTIAAMPLVAWLERRHLPRIAAVLLVLALGVGLFGMVLYLLISQALALAAELPAYEAVLRGKIASLAVGSDPIDRVWGLVQRLGSGMAPAGAAPAVATVVMAEPASSPLSTLFDLAVLVLAPAATLAVTLLLMGFILVGREDARDRVLRLAGLHEMHRTTAALAEATSSLGRLLLMQLLVNALFGVSMGVGLWALGLPNAALWGGLGFALRFVPYLGAPLSVLFPLLLAFATTPGWATVLGVVALFAVVDILVSYALEPWLYGVSTGVSPLALLVSAAFWTMMWGPMGLVLAPALTGCLVILGRHVPSLGFLDVVLGDSTPLPAPARFYQRLLVDDAQAASRLLAAEAERAGAVTAMSTLVFPAIAQISSDRLGESFGPALAIRSARTLLQALAAVPDPLPGGIEVVVLPVGGTLDRAAAAAVVLLLQEAGHAAAMAPRSGATLALVVAAGEAPRHRLLRALRDAAQAAGAVQIFAATDEASHGLAAAGIRLGWTDTPTALLEAAERALEAENPASG